MSEYWQVVRVTGVGLGELWFDGVTTEVSQERAEELARKEADWIAVPIPYEPTEDERAEMDRNFDLQVDDYERGLTR